MQCFAIPCEDTREVKGLSDHSKEVSEDWLYVCRKTQVDEATTYIEEALASGAVVLCDIAYQGQHVYQCKSVEHILQVLIERYYGDICKDFTIIGVTGTNGKTSVSSILSQLLKSDHREVMQIGTGFVRYLDQTLTIHNTTPGSFQLVNYFRKARTLGIAYIVMEVSSHAIDQNRINFVQFDMIVYTNITQDHLDYHLTKTHYRYTKFKLRRYVKPSGCIIYNRDLSYMQELVDMAHHQCISIGLQQAHFSLRNIEMSVRGIAFSLQGYRYHCNLLSMVNVYNVAQALVVCRRLQISYEALQSYVAQLRPVEGRLEVIPCAYFTIWIDYAHTPDAFKTILEFAKQVQVGRIISIVGCGGNRDTIKRPLIGGLAAHYSDVAILTSDNPRDEAMHTILFEMMQNPPNHVLIFENRYFAIKHTIKKAQNDDIIIIAGKGNEDKQVIHGKEYSFSDRACVYERLVKEGIHWK